MKFFDKEFNSFLLEGGVFFYKLTRNPNLTKISFFFFFFFFGGGGWGERGEEAGKGRGEGNCMSMNKCLKRQFYSSRRTPVQNYFEFLAYM